MLELSNRQRSDTSNSRFYRVFSTNWILIPYHGNKNVIIRTIFMQNGHSQITVPWISYHTFVDSFQIKIWMMTNFEKIPIEIMNPVFGSLSSMSGPLTPALYPLNFETIRLSHSI